MATLNIRGIDDTAAKEIKLAAAARGIKIGEYVAALHKLHRTIVDLATWEEERDRDPDCLFSIHPSARELLETVELAIIYT